MSAAATDTIWRGETSMYWIRSGEASMNSFWKRDDTRLSVRRPC